MANNVYAPSGFREWRYLGASATNMAVQTRFIAYNYGTSIAFGDPVFLNTDGTIHLYAATGTTIDGIFLGCEYFDPNHPSEPPFKPAWLAPTLASGTIVRARVAIDPYQTFAAQVNTTSVLTQSVVGQNMDIAAGTSGTPVTGSGMSQCALSGTAANTNTLPFRIISIIGLNDGSGGVAINPSYSPLNGNQWLEVSLNTQDLTTRTGQA